MTSARVRALEDAAKSTDVMDRPEPERTERLAEAAGLVDGLMSDARGHVCDCPGCDAAVPRAECFCAPCYLHCFNAPGDECRAKEDQDVTEPMDPEEVTRAQEVTRNLAKGQRSPFGGVPSGDFIEISPELDTRADLKVREVGGRYMATPARKLPEFMVGDVRWVLEDWSGAPDTARAAIAREMFRACRDALEGYVVRIVPPDPPSIDGAAATVRNTERAFADLARQAQGSSPSED